MSNSIRLSEKHGVNPSLESCFWCGESMGVALLGRLPNDAEAPRHIMTGYDECPKCQEQRALGIKFIEVNTTANFPDQPAMADGVYPTGRCVILKEHVLDSIEPQELREKIRRKRAAFVLSSMWDQIIGPTD